VFDTIVLLIEGALASPWGLLGLCVVAAIDAFFPVVPSESRVITAGVFAVGGDASLPLGIAAAGLGAFAGDHVSYLVGRRAGDRLAGRLRAGSRTSIAYAWAGKVLAKRGGTVIVAARYIPGGRTAMTLTAGAVRYPLRSFSTFDGLAAGSWATYAALVGYVGGAAFEDDPLKGTLLGLGLALGVTGLIELVRNARTLPGSEQKGPMAAKEL
jgi:membrane-associated protein